MKRWRNIVIGTVVGLYFPVMFSFVAVDKGNVVCGEIVPSITDGANNKFISEEEIREIVLEKYAGILGRKMDEVNCNQMETFLSKHPAIENCEVYLTYGGALHVEVTQREPVVRVFDGDASYYLDMNGRKMPLFKSYSAHVLVAGGFIKRLENEGDLVNLARLIHEDAFWNAQIEQVYVDPVGEVTMVPRVGDHLIEFGKIEDVEIKFRNLKALYKSGWEAREWNLYKKVSLKYKGQVVCTKG